MGVCEETYRPSNWTEAIRWHTAKKLEEEQRRCTSSETRSSNGISVDRVDSAVQLEFNFHGSENRCSCSSESNKMPFAQDIAPSAAAKAKVSLSNFDTTWQPDSPSKPCYLSGHCPHARTSLIRIKLALLAIAWFPAILVSNYGASIQQSQVNLPIIALHNLWTYGTVDWITDPPPLVFLAATTSFGLIVAIVWMPNESQLEWQRVFTMAILLATTVLGLFVGIPLLCVILQVCPWATYLVCIVCEMWISLVEARKRRPR